MTNSFLNRYLKLIFSFSLLLFSACEYDNNEMNYYELTPPEEKVEVSVNLANMPENEMIYIYTYTFLDYSLNFSSGELLSKHFFIDNTPISDNDGKIYLHPSYFTENKECVLKVILKFTSATGSLAEFFGKEQSDEIVFTYPIKFVKPDFSIKLDQRVNSSNFLEIFWDKPEIEGAKIEKYEVYSSFGYEQTLIKAITNPNEIYFEDRSYVYGEKFFRVVAYINAGGETYKSEDYYKVKYTEITEQNIKFELLNDGKFELKINNPNPYKCKYFVKQDENILWSVVNQNKMLFAERPEFPTYRHNYMIYLVPNDIKEIDNRAYYPYIFAEFKDLSFSQLINNSNELGSLHRYFYDLENEFILFHHKLSGNNVVKKEYLAIYDTNKKNLTNNILIPNLENRIGFEHTNNVFKQINSSKVLVASQIDISHHESNYAFVYSSFKLDNLEKKITLNPGEWVVSYTANNQMLTNESGGTYNLYNCTTGALIKTWNFSIYDNCELSPNGKYLIRINDSKQYYFYKIISNLDLELLYSGASSGIKEINSHPLNEDIVYINHYGNYVNTGRADIIDLTTKSKIKHFDYDIADIDAKTGNICLVGGGIYDYKMHILNNDYSQYLYTVKISDYYSWGFWLFNNTVISSYYIFDISKAIKQ